VLGGEHLPDHEEERRDNGADDEAGYAEDGEAAQGGDQHQVVRHLRLAPDQDGSQQVVDEPDDQRANRDEHQALHDLPHGEQDDRRRRPDEAGAHRGKDGKQRHDEAPEDGRGDAQRPEEGAADRALHHPDHEGTLDGGARDLGELCQEPPLALVSQRQRADEGLHEPAAVADEEEEDVEHHEEEGGEPHHVLAHRQRL
jgi:hypothetical protein